MPLTPCLYLCIDPGTSNTGWAVFYASSPAPIPLVGCGHTPYKKILASLQQFLLPFLTKLQHTPRMQLVIEVPKKYQYEPHPVGDMLTLSFRAGVIAGIQHIADITTYHPDEWKGSVPKDVHHRRILTVLTPDESDLLKQTKSARSRRDTPSPDMLDAIGIGLFHLGRTGRGGVRHPGALHAPQRVGRLEDAEREDDKDRGTT